MRKAVHVLVRSSKFLIAGSRYVSMLAAGIDLVAACDTAFNAHQLYCALPPLQRCLKKLHENVPDHVGQNTRNSKGPRTAHMFAESSPALLAGACTLVFWEDQLRLSPPQLHPHRGIVPLKLRNLLTCRARDQSPRVDFECIC